MNGKESGVRSQKTEVKVSEITLHGLTIIIIETDEWLDWCVEMGTAEQEALATRYLYEDGFLEEWFGADVVAAILKEAQDDEEAA